MAITVTLPIVAPTGLSASLVSGGSLAASTTYYYIVTAHDSAYTSPGTSTRFNYYSPISAESSFTTDATNLSALITWTNVSGATNYQILITTTSGDYTDSAGYGTSNEGCGTITDGTTGYTVTAVSALTHVFHSCQLVNDLVGNLDKDIGCLKVSIDGGTYTTTPLKTIYDAIVAAGYSDYIYFDGYNFFYKGWIVTEGTDSGYMQIYNANLIFIKGGVHCGNANYYIQFGSWTSDLVGAYYRYGCNIDIQNARYPFRGISDGLLRLYGSYVNIGKSVSTLETENRSGWNYWYGGANSYQALNISEFKDSILGTSIRGITSEIRDLKVAIGNNWSNYPVFRLNVYANRTLAYYAGGKFYACKWTTINTTSSAIKMYVPASGATYYSDFYDCEFPQYSDNIPYFRYGTNYGNVLSDSYTQHNFSINIKIIDENGDPMSGVDVSLIDTDGNPGLWLEHDGTTDKEVTGNEYTTARTTDSNGLIDTYYVKSYKVNLADDNTIADAYCDNIVFTDYYPFTVTLSKSGYSDYSILLDTLLESTELLIKYTSGNLPDKPEFKFITHKRIGGV